MGPNGRMSPEREEELASLLVNSPSWNDYLVPKIRLQIQESIHAIMRTSPDFRVKAGGDDFLRANGVALTKFIEGVLNDASRYKTRMVERESEAAEEAVAGLRVEMGRSFDLAQLLTETEEESD